MMNNKIKSALFTGMVLVVGLLTLFPFYLMMMMGTYYTNDLFHGVVLVPGKYLLENLKTILQNNFLIYYWNSFYVSVSSTILTQIGRASCRERV